MTVRVTNPREWCERFQSDPLLVCDILDSWYREATGLIWDLQDDDFVERSRQGMLSGRAAYDLPHFEDLSKLVALFCDSGLCSVDPKPLLDFARYCFACCMPCEQYGPKPTGDVMEAALRDALQVRDCIVWVIVGARKGHDVLDVPKPPASKPPKRLAGRKRGVDYKLLIEFVGEHYKPRDFSMKKVRALWKDEGHTPTYDSDNAMWTAYDRGKKRPPNDLNTTKYTE